MTRVLLVVANREQFPEPAFPAGALYVARAVEASGGRVRVFDAGLYRRPLNALGAELESWRPDFVGLSLRNADNAAWPHTRSYADWYARVADAARAAAPRARLVLGGPAFSIFPREMRRALLVADGVVG
ncbi:MAG TPA: cobalamin-dependent protein, partial [Thermoleophilia bacterium]